MTNCLGFSKGKVLYKLSEVWKKHLLKYADDLTARIPKISPAYAMVSKSLEQVLGNLLMQGTTSNTETMVFSPKERITVCYIVKTADYCQQNLEGNKIIVCTHLHG